MKLIKMTSSPNLSPSDPEKSSAPTKILGPNGSSSCRNITCARLLLNPSFLRILLAFRMGIGVGLITFLILIPGSFPYFTFPFIGMMCAVQGVGDTIGVSIRNSLASFTGFLYASFSASLCSLVFGNHKPILLIWSIFSSGFIAFLMGPTTPLQRKSFQAFNVIYHFFYVQDPTRPWYYAFQTILPALIGCGCAILPSFLPLPTPLTSSRRCQIRSQQAMVNFSRVFHLLTKLFVQTPPNSEATLIYNESVRFTNRQTKSLFRQSETILQQLDEYQDLHSVTPKQSKKEEQKTTGHDITAFDISAETPGSTEHIYQNSNSNPLRVEDFDSQSSHPFPEEIERKSREKENLRDQFYQHHHNSVSHSVATLNYSTANAIHERPSLESQFSYLSYAVPKSSLGKESSQETREGRNSRESDPSSQDSIHSVFNLSLPTSPTSRTSLAQFAILTPRSF